MKKIKVLIVDDSIVAQNIMQVIFQQDPELQVVGTAGDHATANELLEKTNPDVMTLDVAMPQMDGITYLRHLMKTHPMPVVMVSVFTEPGGSITLEALAIGAVDYIEKPKINDPAGLQVYAKRLIEIVKNAAKANIKPLTAVEDKKKGVTSAEDKLLFQPNFLSQQLIVIGASTGGVEAVESLLSSFPENISLPGIMLVQHIQPEFVNSFARRINKLYNGTAFVAKEDMEVGLNQIVVACGGAHLTVVERKGHYFCHLEDEPNMVTGHRPSVDMLFNSAANASGRKTIGILLTGMGKDGAQGLKAIKEAGGDTIAQDKESSVVWGMPGEAVRLNAASFTAPLKEIPDIVLAILSKRAEEWKRRIHA